MADAALKVLLLSGPFQVRGTSSYTLRLARLLATHDVNAVVVAPDASRIERKTRESLGIHVYPNLDLPIWDRVVLEGLAHDLADDPPDLIHVQTPDMLRQANRLATRLERPYVVTAHHHFTNRQRLRFDPHWGRRVIALSESVRYDVQQHGQIPEQHLTVIHGGVETDVGIDVRGVLDPDHDPVVGTAGPLEAVKGLPYFLDAAAIVAESNTSIQFLIAGAGPEERHLRQLADQRGIAGRTTFIPNLFDFESALAAMDVFCLPSLRQGLGTIMLQAMAMGKPVVASGLDAVHSIIENGHSGLLFPPGDSALMAGCIQDLLHDPVRARALGESGRQLIRERFSVNRMVERTVAVYREVVEQSVGSQAVSS